jgi:hypothetical protein
MEKLYKSASLKKETHLELVIMSAQLDIPIIDLIDKAVKLLKEKKTSAPP